MAIRSDSSAPPAITLDSIMNGTATGSNIFIVGNTGGNTSTNKSSSISHSDATRKVYSSQEAKALAVSAFQEAIGRAPTQAELAQFVSALNKAESKNVSITSGSTFTSRVNDTSTAVTSSGTNVNKSRTVDQTGSTSSSNTTSGGLDEVQFAKDYASGLQGYSGYQKATNYFNAFISALNGPGGGVR
jgi:hypothetical protein